MDDKTSSILQPSTTFGDSSTSTTHSPHLPLASRPTYTSTSLNSILSAKTSIDNMEHKKQFDISNLMSPPESTPMESFSRVTARQSVASKAMTPQPGNNLPISPPISPEELNKVHNTPEDLEGVALRDPILYPEVQSSPSSQPSLFVEEVEHQRVVERHIAARADQTFGKASPPRSSDYKLALEFRSQVLSQFSKNPVLWRARERAQLRMDNALQSGSRYQKIAPASATKPSRPSTKQVKVKKDKVTKPKPIIRQGSPSATKKVARDDSDFNALRDYSPPTSSLPNKPNSLKTDWKGSPIDLRDDPNLKLLHPDEVILAANLRLDCATYLTQKRRLFIERINCLRIGKEFRKTDAQQACKIDVNKASKLWQSFEKVGWLNPKWVAQYV